MVWTQAAATKNINIAWFVLTGILERHPGLQLALIDAGAGWLPTCCELIDWNYRYAQFLAFAKLKDTPGDYIRRHVKATVRNERNTVESRADVGVKALMWSSSYPNSHVVLAFVTAHDRGRVRRHTRRRAATDPGRELRRALQPSGPRPRVGQRYGGNSGLLGRKRSLLAARALNLPVGASLVGALPPFSLLACRYSTPLPCTLGSTGSMAVNGDKAREGRSWWAVASISWR